YHKYEDEWLRHFVVDYMGDRLYPKHIRQVIHKIDSIESQIAYLSSVTADINKASFKIKNKDFDQALLLLESLARRLKGSKREEKKDAKRIIISVIEDIKSRNSDGSLKNLIIARGELHSYINELFKQANTLEIRLKRQVKHIKLASIKKNEKHDGQFLAMISEEFEKWNKGKGSYAGLHDKIVQFYTIWFSRGERSPPDIDFIYEVIKDKKIKELKALVYAKDKNFDSLSEYRKWKLIDGIAKGDNLNVEESGLLRELMFTPRFYWGEKVPEEARDHICMLTRRDRFGINVLKPKSVIRIDYKEKVPGKDFLARDDSGKLSYWSSPSAGDTFRILSNFSGEPIKHFKEIWNKGAKGRASVYSQYHSYHKTKILQDYIWENEKQVYSMSWRDFSGIKHETEWVLAKDLLTNRVISLLKKGAIDNIYALRRKYSRRTDSSLKSYILPDPTLISVFLVAAVGLIYWGMRKYIKSSRGPSHEDIAADDLAGNNQIDERIFEWLLKPYYKDVHKKVEELVRIGDSQKISELFSGKLGFESPSGMRGFMETIGTNRMNVYTVKMAAQAFTVYLKSLHEADSLIKKGVVVGFDTRNNSRDFAKAFSDVLLANGIKVYLNKEAEPLAVCSFGVNELNAAFGIYIGSSQYDKECNGIRVIGDSGRLADDEILETLKDINMYIGMADVKDANGVEPVYPGRDANDYKYDIRQRYIYNLFENLPVDNEHFTRMLKILEEEGRPVKVVCETLYGASGRILEEIAARYRKYGLKLYFVEEHLKPDGKFKGVKDLRPMGENLKNAEAFANEVKADLIIGFDTEALMAVMKVRNLTGEWLELTSNQQASFIFASVMAEMEKNGNLPQKNRAFLIKPTVATNMLKAIAKFYGIQTEDVPLGFKYIAKFRRDLKRLFNNDNLFCFLMGGFYGGTFIGYERDGIEMALLGIWATTMAKANNKNTPEALNDIYRVIGKYYGNISEEFRFISERQANKVWDKILDIDKRVTRQHKKVYLNSKYRIDRVEVIGSHDISFYLHDGSIVMFYIPPSKPDIIRVYVEKGVNITRGSNRQKFISLQSTTDVEIRRVMDEMKKFIGKRRRMFDMALDMYPDMTGFRDEVACPFGYNIIVADFDDTLVKADSIVDPEMKEYIEYILRYHEKRGIKFYIGIVTGSNIDKVEERFIDHIDFALWRYFYISDTGGSSDYTYDALGKRKEVYSVREKFSKYEDRAGELIKEVLKSFELGELEESKGVKVPGHIQLDRRGTQLTVYYMRDASKGENGYWEYPVGGDRRKEIAVELNRLFKGESLPLKAEAKGKTSIDIVLEDVNKARAVERFVYWTEDRLFHRVPHHRILTIGDQPMAADKPMFEVYDDNIDYPVSATMVEGTKEMLRKLIMKVRHREELILSSEDKALQEAIRKKKKIRIFGAIKQKKIVPAEESYLDARKTEAEYIAPALDIIKSHSPPLAEFIKRYLNIVTIELEKVSRETLIPDYGLTRRVVYIPRLLYEVIKEYPALLALAISAPAYKIQKWRKSYLTAVKNPFSIFRFKGSISQYRVKRRYLVWKFRKEAKKLQKRITDPGRTGTGTLLDNIIEDIVRSNEEKNFVSGGKQSMEALRILRTNL
ncbi:MAG: hypothetical protein KKH08_06700, partial [Candidatus Omnitrophica bacterium]|nr:hypothetical protein [Candidatus Omnitrophota bacterium]